MSLKNLIKGGPRNIRKRLFRDIVAIVLVTTSAIIILTIFQGRSINDKISTQLIKESSRLVQKRFINYLTQYETTLKILARMGDSSLLDHSDVQLLEKILIPILNVHNDLDQVTIIDKTGNYTKLTRTGSTYESVIETNNKDNSLLISNSYRGAMTAPENRPVFWSESFTSVDEESGVSASIRVKLPHLDTVVVVVFFIPATKLITFITDIETPDNVDIILFNSQGFFLSKQQLYHPGESAETKNRPEIAIAIKLWAESVNPEQSVKKFRSRGITWWAGYIPLDETTNNFWISIIVPETDIIEDVYRQWLQLGAFAGAILLISIFMTVSLVRRYSFQLKDLPHQNLVNTDFQNSLRKLIVAGESSTLEFKSTMRNNLKTGKHGKEMEIAWLKSVSAFMNSDGGIILIGVSDDGRIIGNEADGFINEDKCGLHFKNLINSHIGKDFARDIHLKFCKFEENSILVIECERVRRPVFLTIGKTEDFYIRSGPSSIKLSMSQMITYLSER